MATNTAVMKFPKEFERHVFRDINKELIVIIIIGYFLCFTGCFIMSQTRIDLSDIEQTNSPLPPISVPLVETPVVQSPVEKSKPVAESGPTGIVGGAEAVASHAAALGRARGAAASAFAGLGSVGVFRQAGVGGGGGGAGGGGGGGGGGFGGGAGLGGVGSGAGGGGYGVGAGLGGIATGGDLNKMNVIGVNARDAQLAAKLGAGGKYVEGAIGKGKIDIASLTPADIDNLIARAKVQARAPAQVISSTGAEPTAKGRTAADVQAKMGAFANQIRSCYQTYLRRDPNLNGEVAFSYTIKPNGTVSKVQITGDNWSDSNYGKQVETCIRERVQTWKFDAVAPTAGDLTVNYSYVFTR